MNLLPVIQAVELGGGASLVRVAMNQPDLIMRALDVGAIGVVVPMVSTPHRLEPPPMPPDIHRTAPGPSAPSATSTASKPQPR